MKFIEWSKKNYLIIILFIIVVWILAIKINIYMKDNKTSNLPITSSVENKPEILIDNSPTPTIVGRNIFGNKTREEILQMDPEDRESFISDLSREENEELDMMPNYPLLDFLPYISQNFIVEKYDRENKKLTVKPLIDDKAKIKFKVEDWLFYETGNNPKKIEIIWSE